MDLLPPQAVPKCFCNIVASVEGSHGMKAPWERGRPARTNPGTASVISTTWINRERRPGSMLFPPTGWSIALKLSAGQAANAAGCQDRPWPSLRGRPGTGAGTCLGRNKVRAGRPRSRGITPLLRESRGSRAEGRRLMRWGGGAGPAGRGIDFFTINRDAQD